VAAQRFNAAKFLRASPSQLAHTTQMASYASRFARTGAFASGALRAEAEWPAKAAVNLRLLGKGVSWALGIEGATAVCLYAAWFLWHVWQ